MAGNDRLRPAAGRAWPAWLVPVTLGILVMAATAILGPRYIDTRPASPQPWQTAAEAGYVLPFEPSPTGGVLLVVAPHGQGSALEAMRREGLQGNISWLAPEAPLFGKLVVPTVEPLHCPCVPAERAFLLNATVYIFRAQGTLLASNDEPGRVLRFEPDPNFLTLPDTWSFGAGPPPGGVAFPAEWEPVLAQIRPHLADLAAGAVATFVLEEHPQRALVGPLYVTLRIDEVLPVEGAGSGAGAEGAGPA